VLVLALLCVSTVSAAAATLTDAASKAFDEYLGRARQAFLDRQQRHPAATDADRAALGSGRTIAGPGGGDGIVNAPASLIHHWRGVIFIPDVTLDDTVRISRDYRNYPSVFHPIVRSTVLSDESDAIRVQFRMRESAGGMTAVLDVLSNIHYVRPDSAHAYVISTSEQILEVEDPGRPTERHLPAGRDSGYLWRAATFSRFVADDGGVYMEMETLGLSRPFPPLLGWLIEPVARRIGRRSVEDSMTEFQRAVLMRYAPAKARSSLGVSARHLPIGSVPITTDPILTRTSLSAFAPSASTIRRTWRLRPSVSVISKWVYLAESRTLATFAGRVGPSASSIPSRSC
jgi:hypothetical protein